MSSVGNPRRNARKRDSPAPRHRALELLGTSRDGCTEAIMLAHGFSNRHDGRDHQRRARERDDPSARGRWRELMEVTRVRITEAGGGRYTITSMGKATRPKNDANRFDSASLYGEQKASALRALQP